MSQKVCVCVWWGGGIREGRGGGLLQKLTSKQGLIRERQLVEKGDLIELLW